MEDKWLLPPWGGGVRGRSGMLHGGVRGAPPAPGGGGGSGGGGRGKLHVPLPRSGRQ